MLGVRDFFLFSKGSPAVTIPHEIIALSHVCASVTVDADARDIAECFVTPLHQKFPRPVAALTAHPQPQTTFNGENAIRHLENVCLLHVFLLGYKFGYNSFTQVYR